MEIVWYKKINCEFKKIIGFIVHRVLATFWLIFRHNIFGWPKMILLITLGLLVITLPYFRPGDVYFSTTHYKHFKNLVIGTKKRVFLLSIVKCNLLLSVKIDNWKIYHCTFLALVFVKKINIFCCMVFKANK